MHPLIIINNHMKQLLVILGAYLTFNCLTAQTVQHVVINAYLHPLEVKNKTVTDVLEAIDSEIEECIFAKHGFPYCYGIDATLFNSGIVHVSFYSIQNFFIHSPYTGYGYFYYKDKIVLVEETSSRCELYEKWFERKENIDTFQFVRPNTNVFFTPKSCLRIEGILYTYRYRNDSSELIDSRHCSQLEEFYHRVGYNETSWEYIADMYQTPLDSIKAKNKPRIFKSPPKRGQEIRVY